MILPRHVLALSALLFACPAQADDGALTLSQGEIFTDDVGSVIGVAIANGGAVAIESVDVTCSFSARGKSAGSASTTLFNLLPGARGEDQVHMMGTRADEAACRISATKPAVN